MNSEKTHKVVVCQSSISIDHWSKSFSDVIIDYGKYYQLNFNWWLLQEKIKFFWWQINRVKTYGLSFKWPHNYRRKEFDHLQALKKFSVEWSTIKRLSKVVLQDSDGTV